MRFLFPLVVFIALLASSAPTVSAKEAGSQPGTLYPAVASRLQAIERVLQDDVDAGERAGYVVAIATREGVVYRAAVGDEDRYEGKPMTLDTRFRLASMTKPIVSVAIMQLVERGEIALSEPTSYGAGSSR